MNSTVRQAALLLLVAGAAAGGVFYFFSHAPDARLCVHFAASASL